MRLFSSLAALYIHPQNLLAMLPCRFWKSALFLGVVLLFAPQAEAQTKDVTWRLDRVTCHEVGAVLSYEGSVQASGGEWRAVLGNLPSDIDVSSAQIELPDGMQLVAVNKTTPLPDVADDVAYLSKQADAKRLALGLELALLEAVDQERAYLEANRSIGGGGEVLLVDDVEEMRHYLAQRFQELALDRVDIATNVAALEKEVASADRDLQMLLNEAAQPTHALELVMSGQGRGLARVHVATQQAGWVSSYDVSWEESKGQLRLERFARVVQTTGEDWSQVALELRTGQPMGLNPVPQVRPQLQSADRASYDGYCANVQWVNSRLQDAGARQDVLRGQGALASNWEMEADQRVSVAGNGDAARVWLDAHALDATPRWTARPQTSETALRSCHTKSWMDIRALSGEGRIFQENAMVGVLPLNMPSWGDSLVVQLGMDDGVRSTTELRADESGTRRLSGKRVVEQVRVVKVHNQGSSVATVDVVEQLPLGGDMEVEAEAGGMWDASTGEVRWPAVQVPASGSWEATLRVRIVVPKNGSVVGL